MGHIGADRGGAGFAQGDGGIAQGAGGIDDVIDQDAALAIDIANNVHHFADAGTLATLIDDRQFGFQSLGDGAGPHHAANIGRHDDKIAATILGDEAFLDVLGQDTGCEQIIGRDIEEALNLSGMQIDGEDAVGAGCGDQIGDQLR